MSKWRRTETVMQQKVVNGDETPVSKGFVCMYLRVRAFPCACACISVCAFACAYVCVYAFARACV